MELKFEKNPLTKRETEIIKLLVEEMTNQEVANKLNLSINTVETHRKNIMKRLKINSLLGLYRWVVANGI